MKSHGCYYLDKNRNKSNILIGSRCISVIGENTQNSNASEGYKYKYITRHLASVQSVLT